MLDEPLPGMNLPACSASSGRASEGARIPSARVVDRSLIPTDTTVALFWSKVVESPTCWYWTGAISAPDGYGRINYQRGLAQRTVLAHRFAVELVYGPLAPAVVCEHKCNEPLCVRVGPDHLVQSTYSENVRYAIALGRMSGHTPLDAQGRSRYQRSLDIRDALRDGYDPGRLLRAKTASSPDQDTLF